MKKTIRKNVLLSLSLLSLGALAVGGVVWTKDDFVAVNADGVPFSESIEMFNGAKIRTDGPMGIRFGAELTNYNAENGYTYGMLIVPTDYLTTYGVSDDYVNAFANYDNGDGTTGVKIAHMTCEVNYGDSDLDGDEEYYIQGSLITLKYENLNRPFTGIAYIKDASDNYLYTTTNPSRSASYVASAAMLDYANDTEGPVYQACLTYVHGGVNLENEITDETTGYVATSNFTATVGGADALTNGDKDSIALTVGDEQALTVTQAPAMGYVVGYSSANNEVATVSADGVITAVATGSTTVTVKCIDKTKEIKVHVVTQKFDGVVSANEYEAVNAFDTSAYDTGLDSTATVCVKSYAEGVAIAVVVNGAYINYASETTSSSTGNNGGGLELMMSKDTTNTNTTGLRWRVFADGSVRAVKNLNNAAPSTTRTLYPTCGASAYVVSGVGNHTDGYTQITLEYFVEYETVGATSANDFYLAVGLVENSSDNTSRSTLWENSGDTSDDKASASDYKTIAQYEEKGMVDPILLDGVVDTLYTEYLTYSMSNTGKTSSADIKVYWYKASDAVYLAFDVTETGTAKTLNNTVAANKDPGSAALAIVCTNINATEFSNAMYMRAWASGQVRTKDITSTTTSFAPNDRTTSGLVCGSISLAANGTKLDITSYVIEMRIPLTAAGVTSVDDMGFIFGYFHSDKAIRFYNRSEKTADNPDISQVTTIANSNYYWTLADMEAAKVSE